MHVVITGSRHWKDPRQVYDVLDALLEEFPALQLHHGKSRGKGVDWYAEIWAGMNDVPVWPYPVRKDLDGDHRGAPLNRNTRMLKTSLAELVVAFRSPGKSNGTDDCVNKAEKMGIEVRMNEEKINELP